MALKVHSAEGGATFGVKVQAGAKKTEPAGLWDENLKLKVAKKPEDGAANAECLAYLARRLGVSRQDLRIIKGEFSPHKVIWVKGLTAQQVGERLAEQG